MKIFVTSATVDFVPFTPDNNGRVISVFLKGGGKHNFRCIECGKIIFQYIGEVESIFDGAKIPEEKAVLDVLCHRCRLIYRVM